MKIIKYFIILTLTCKCVDNRLDYSQFIQINEENWKRDPFTSETDALMSKQKTPLLLPIQPQRRPVVFKHYSRHLISSIDRKGF